ncbi:PTX4 protein, partial [Galbula dea]|nr:PTX4 protein [Galbula dea]
FCLLLSAALQGGLNQVSGPVSRPGTLLLRLRRLEEQFLRLQEVTLSHLQSIAENYNISYNIDGRFRALAEQAEVATAARATLGAELARLATTGRRLHRRLKRLEGTVGALSSPHRLLTHPQGWVAPGTPRPRHLKARQRQQRQQKKGHRLLADAEPGEVPGQDAASPHNAEPGAQVVTPALLPMMAISQSLAPQLPGEACHTGTALLFPNISGEHMAILRPGPRQGLQALSLCAWLATPASQLGALLSYATEDGGSELAVRGHSRELTSSARFVIGDGQFRELPVTPLLDGKWHHFCLTWSSDQGQYRFYVDRRLLAAGSGFWQGYEIPAGGLLVLGWEQDHPSKDFSTTEAFVGHLAGFAFWSRALLPGEVASMATGQGLPRGPLLTLADASLQGGVQRVSCPCLQHC